MGRHYLGTVSQVCKLQLEFMVQLGTKRKVVDKDDPKQRAPNKLLS